MFGYCNPLFSITLTETNWRMRLFHVVSQPSKHLAPLHTICYSMHKMWIFTILKPYFHHKKCEAIPDSSWQTWVFMIFETSSHQVKSEFISYYCKEFQNPVFPTVFNGCCAILKRLKLNTSSLRNAWRTGLDTSSGDDCCIDLILPLEAALRCMTASGWF